MKIIQVINFNICKNWLLGKKRFLEIKRVTFFPKNLAFSLLQFRDWSLFMSRGGGGREKYVGKIKISVSLLQTI